MVLSGTNGQNYNEQWSIYVIIRLWNDAISPLEFEQWSCNAHHSSASMTHSITYKRRPKIWNKDTILIIFIYTKSKRNFHVLEGKFKIELKEDKIKYGTNDYILLKTE